MARYSKTRRGVVTVGAGEDWTAVASDDCTDQQTEADLPAGGTLVAFEAVNRTAASALAYYKLNADNLVDDGGAGSPILAAASVPDLDVGATIGTFAVKPAADGALVLTVIWGYR